MDTYSAGMEQRPLAGFSVEQRNGKGNLTRWEKYRIERDETGKYIEVLVEREEWEVIDGLNQRVYHWRKEAA